MKPAYYQSQNTGRDRWMISYLDVLTIMLILFVAIAAQALQSAQKKPDPAVAPVAVPVAVPLIPAPNAALVAIKQELEQNHLEVQLDPRGVVVSLPQALLFSPGEDRINADAIATVSAIGNVLSKIPNSVSLEGHADAVPIHNRRFNNNWELGAARGLRLLELLSRYGIAESRFSIESYGAYDPKSTNDTPDGRASNRRVEIVIRDTAPRSTL
ncbi:MAG TPA: OmpA family protein [Bryobacteraceae bacterium]|jgi:chemotaxis protein MotB|nr:OmpA family protein [Bryobacteraceae bacterium]